MQCCGSAAFFDGIADRDPTLHFDADPDPDLSQSFTHIVESENRFTFFTAVPVYIDLSFSSAFQYFGQYSIIKFSGKRIGYTSHLAEMDLDPDRYSHGL